MSKQLSRLMIWLLCCILLLSSVSVAFAGGGAANASGGNAGADTNTPLPGMTQLGGYNMYKISVYMGLTNAKGNDPKKYTMGDFVKISSYYTTNGGAGGAINCRTFPASDKYRQFEDPTAPKFAGQPTMASYAVFGSNIPNWRTTGTSGQVNKDVIPYLKGVAASTNKESKEAYNRMQFYGVYQRFQAPSAIITHNNLLSVYRSQFKLYNKEGNRIENDLIDFTQLSPASAVKNEATGELEKPA